MKSKFLFVSITPKRMTKGLPTFKSYEKISNTYLNSEYYWSITTTINNDVGLPEAYNKKIENHINDGYNYMIFLHDDIWIYDTFIFEKLEEAFKKYDIVGLAGSSEFDITKNPICWHNSSRTTWRGFVEHPQEFPTATMNSFGPQGACVVLDGLFLAVKTSKLREGLRFDEDFKFDFYDSALCLDAQLNYNCKLGTAPIHVKHDSHGEGIRKQSYADAQKLFFKKYSK